MDPIVSSKHQHYTDALGCILPHGWCLVYAGHRDERRKCKNVRALRGSALTVALDIIESIDAALADGSNDRLTRVLKEYIQHTACRVHTRFLAKKNGKHYTRVLEESLKEALRALRFAGPFALHPPIMSLQAPVLVYGGASDDLNPIDLRSRHLGTHSDTEDTQPFEHGSYHYDTQSSMEATVADLADMLAERCNPVLLTTTGTTRFSLPSTSSFTPSLYCINCFELMESISTFQSDATDRASPDWTAGTIVAANQGSRENDSQENATQSSAHTGAAGTDAITGVGVPVETATSALSPISNFDQLFGCDSFDGSWDPSILLSPGTSDTPGYLR